MFKKSSFLIISILLALLSPATFAQSSDFDDIVESWNKEIYFKNGNFNGGFTIMENETKEEAEKRFYQEHNKFLNLKIQETKAELQNRDADEGEMQRNFEFLKELQDAKKSDVIFFVKENDKLDKKDMIFLDKYRKSSVFSTRSANNPWEPFKGSLDINQSYVSNSFYFNNVEAFNSDRTYEHETQVYDPNYADYAWYWTSNMPNAYYDTPFLDDIDIFTIWSSDTSDFQSYKKYTTYMSLKPGSTNNAWIIVKWQIGHRNPGWCHSTWCIWADSTSSRLTTGTAPFAISWIR